MICFVIYLICFISSAIGAVCGIGGGVIIKPALDAFAFLSVSEVNCLSGCTVLAMACYSVGATILKRESVIELGTITPLAIGSAVGGVLGKELLVVASEMFKAADTVGAVQAACIFVLTLGALIFTIMKHKIKPRNTIAPLGCFTVGLILGVVSSFLSIGGGPINLVVLYFFFSMPAKAAAQNSLYIILFSQTANLLHTLASSSIPELDFSLCAGMAVCGISGGIIGRRLNRRLSDAAVNCLFISLMTLILFISAYNICKFRA